MNLEMLHSPDLERAIIGAIALEPALISKLRLKEADFYSPRHTKIFRAMLELHREGVPADSVTLLPKIGDEDAIYVSTCAAETVTASNFPHYELALLELTQKRRIQKVCLDGLENFGSGPPDEVISFLRNESLRLLSDPPGQTKIVDSGRMAQLTWNFIETRYRSKGAIAGIPSGLRDLDQVTDGWSAGDLIILAGRPGSGKSALALSFAMAAATQGNPTGFLSLEMTDRGLGIRSFSALSKVELWKLRKGFLGADDFSAISRAAERLTKLPIFFSFPPKDLGAISTEICRLVEIHGCRLILVDYLQLIHAERIKEHRERQVAEISWALKNAAQLHNIPIIALSQLNRDSERQGRKPILADLRESGAIEQDADVVLFIYRKTDEETPSQSGPVQLSISKGRHIGVGLITILFDSQHMTFRDCGTERS